MIYNNSLSRVFVDLGSDDQHNALLLTYLSDRYKVGEQYCQKLAQKMYTLRVPKLNPELLQILKLQNIRWPV